MQVESWKLQFSFSVRFPHTPDAVQYNSKFELSSLDRRPYVTVVYIYNTRVSFLKIHTRVRSMG